MLIVDSDALILKKRTLPVVKPTIYRESFSQAASSSQLILAISRYCRNLLIVCEFEQPLWYNS